MAEIVNSAEIPQPPSNTAPSTSTPSQPSPAPQAPSPVPQTSVTSTASTLPPPTQPHLTPQQQPQSPAPTPMPPSRQAQAQAQPQIQTNNNTTATFSSYPARAPPGAPGRNYLNTHIAPYLRNGMSNILDIKPQYPLRWLGEYLISQSLIHEGGTDQTSVVEHFIYEEHGAQVIRGGRAAVVAAGSTAVAQSDGVDHSMVNGVVGGNGESEEREEKKMEGQADGGEDNTTSGVGAAEEDVEMGGR